MTNPRFPEKLLYEYITCTHCRKRAKWWMDGVGLCPDHISKVPKSLARFVRLIRYQVEA